MIKQTYLLGQMQPKVNTVAEVKKIVDGLCGNVKSGKMPPREYMGNGGKQPVKEKD